MLDLQRHAGNAAVVGLLQRAPLGATDDPKGYTSAAGVPNVAASGMTRREVRGLKYGVKGGFQSTYTSKKFDKETGTYKEKVRSSAEAKMTKESPDNMAVVVMPDAFAKDRAVQVVLHFHGWGFRGGTDPYAGYLVASGEKGGAPGSARGTVRDVDQEHWAQQIGAVNAERAAQGGPQTVAILAQGRGMSDFGNVPTFAYVQDVLSRVPELTGVSDYSIVLSGHSGGGGTQVAPKVTAGDAQTRDRSKLPASKPGQAASQPSDLVVLFDAEGIESVASWAAGQITSLGRAIRAATTPTAVQAALEATPKFRGYFAAGGAYAIRYDKASRTLGDAFATVPAEWRESDPADPKAVKVPDLFRIIEVSRAGHEHVISGGKDSSEQQGALADALRVTSDPTIDRDRAFGRSKMNVRRTPTSSAPTKAQPTLQKAPANVPTVSRAWTTKDAAGEYALTKDERTLLGSQTSAERAADVTAFKTDTDRVAALEREKKRLAKRKQSLTADEEKELTDIKARLERTESAQRALKRLDVEEILTTAGFTVSGWFGDIQTGSFLGIDLRVHKSLADKLTRAETALVDDPAVNPTKLGAAKLGKTLGMYASTSDLRAPKKAIGGSSLSLHTFGLAVDLNYKGNPFLGNAGKTAPEVVKRATSLVNGTAVDVMTSLGDVRASYTALQAASAAMKTYFSYRDAGQQAALATQVAGHTAQPGEPTDVKGWQAQIETDYTALKDKGDFKKHKPPEEGFLDLDERVVLALTGAGLTWGGTYSAAKDIMHFDNRTGGDGAKVHTARSAHKANT
jgi:hypothetical protein